MPNGKLVKTLENGEIGIGIFIDFEKILMRWTALFDYKYCSFIVTEVHNYLSSYLAERQQFVEINQTSSSSFKVKCGVPQ